MAKYWIHEYLMLMDFATDSRLAAQSLAIQAKYESDPHKAMEYDYQYAAELAKALHYITRARKLRKEATKYGY